MRDLPDDEQSKAIAQYDARVKVSKAIVELRDTITRWVTDREPDMEQFHAAGPKGQYHEYPDETLFTRIVALGWTAEEIAALPENETVLNFMTAEELLYSHQRVQSMIDELNKTPRGTFEKALRMYRTIGERIRRQIIRETGHAPEEFPPSPYRITGQEPAKQFQPTKVQRTPLFPD